MTALTDIPLEELRNDLAETVGDIRVCEIAITHGIESYGDGQGGRDVKWRLKRNQEIKAIIEGELARRGKASVQVVQ
jgi:hypothetical protein